MTKKQDSQYKINDDLSIDVRGCVFLKKKIDYLPVQFNYVSAHFYCSHLGLKSLIGSPRIVGLDFSCAENQLVSLKGGPLKVESFHCEDNQLETLDFLPEIEKNIYCHNNPMLGELQRMHKIKEVRAYLLAQKMNSDLKEKSNLNKKNKI